MTPKEKAVELVHKFDLMQTYIEEFSLQDAKECALIAVNEIISDNASIYSQKYWQEVKSEIKKLKQ